MTRRDRTGRNVHDNFARFNNILPKLNKFTGNASPRVVPSYRKDKSSCSGALRTARTSTGHGLRQGKDKHRDTGKNKGKGQARGMGKDEDSQDWT